MIKIFFVIMILGFSIESRPHFENVIGHYKNRVVRENKSSEKENIVDKPLSGNESIKNEEHSTHRTNTIHKSNHGIYLNDETTKHGNAELHIRNVEDRFVCFSSSYCQNTTSFYIISPDDSFNCEDEFLAIIIDAKFLTAKSDKDGPYLLETIRQAKAFLPQVGELQRDQKKSSCLPIKKYLKLKFTFFKSIIFIN